MVTSITKQGITWTFASDHVAGTYMNGDPWVVGPVSVTSISPATTQIGSRWLHGSMKNFEQILTYGGPNDPLSDGYEQGIDGSGQGTPSHTFYNNALNVARTLPIALAAGDSLISSESAISGIPAGGTGGPWFSPMNNVALLTVVTAPPAANEFRPGYWYPVRPENTYYWDDSMLDFLTTVFPASWGANIAAQTQRLQSLWLNLGSGEGHWRLMGLMHSPDYYVGRGNELGEMFMALNSDIPKANKRALAQAMIQYGLDIINAVKNGQYLGTTHATAKKAPAVFAALMLGHDDFLDLNAICRTDLTTPVEGKQREHRAVWGDDGQTFVVTETSPGVYNYGKGGYTVAHKGMTDWGNLHHLRDGDNDEVDWTLLYPSQVNHRGNEYRQCCAASGWVSTYLSMMAMGAQEIWGWDPWFDWVYRWITTAPSLGLSLQGCPAAVKAVFDLYKPAVPDFTPGFGRAWRQIGLSVPGKPLLTVVGFPNTVSEWQIRVKMPTAMATIGLMVRSAVAAKRPMPRYFGAPTIGHVYVDETTYQASGTFNTDAFGDAFITMAPIDEPGATYTVQAGLLVNGQFVVTNAVEVTIQGVI